MKKGFMLLLLLVMFMSNKTYDSNILIQGVGSNYFGVAIIAILGALLMRSTEDKK